jgi:hypothetical protein
MNNDNVNYNKKVKLMSSMIAGATEAICMQPLDTIKVLKQSNQYNGLFNTINNQGISRFYKGLSPFIFQRSFTFLLRFGAFDKLKDPNNHYLGNLRAGIIAGAIESTFTTPFELVKTNLQTSQNKNPISTMKNIFQTNGFKGMYRGYLSTCARQCINQGSNFTIYHEIRKKIIKENETPNIFKIAMAGMISGSVGPLLNNPFDVVKTRFMNPTYNKKYTNIPNTLITILKEEGIGSLYKGMGLRMIRVGGGQAITFTVIENLMYYFNRK